MVGITNSGDFKKTNNFLSRLLHGDIYSNLDRYGRVGVDALSRATPVDSSLTAVSWQYRVIKDRRNPGIEWFNTNIDSEGTPVAILIQYGHATRSGSHIAGVDYINPALRPIFDQIVVDVWREVTK